MGSKDTNPKKMLFEWIHNLEKTIQKKQCVEICEATRMVVSIASIVNAYHPKIWTKEIEKKVIHLLKDSLHFFDDILEKGEIPDGETLVNCQYYQRNIEERYQSLKQVIPIWETQSKEIQ